MFLQTNCNHLEKKIGNAMEFKSRKRNFHHGILWKDTQNYHTNNDKVL